MKFVQWTDYVAVLKTEDCNHVNNWSEALIAITYSERDNGSIQTVQADTIWSRTPTSYSLRQSTNCRPDPEGKTTTDIKAKTRRYHNTSDDEDHP
jgi:hypothetical protein